MAEYVLHRAGCRTGVGAGPGGLSDCPSGPGVLLHPPADKWKKYINQPSVKISSRVEGYIGCQPYRDITKLGKPALPYIFEKMKEGEFFLWHAAEEIMKMDLSKSLKEENAFVSEQEISEEYVRWWENKGKLEK